MTLVDDAFYEILLHASLPETMILCQSNKKSYHLCQQSNFWYKKLQYHFPNMIYHTTDYMNEYSHLYDLFVYAQQLLAVIRLHIHLQNKLNPKTKLDYVKLQVFDDNHVLEVNELCKMNIDVAFLPPAWFIYVYDKTITLHQWPITNGQFVMFMTKLLYYYPTLHVKEIIVHKYETENDILYDHVCQNNNTYWCSVWNMLLNPGLDKITKYY